MERIDTYRLNVHDMLQILASAVAGEEEENGENGAEKKGGIREVCQTHETPNRLSIGLLVSTEALNAAAEGYVMGEDQECEVDEEAYCWQEAFTLRTGEIAISVPAKKTPAWLMPCDMEPVEGTWEDEA